jgi:dTDP-4-dehydrorhamnose reductase
MKKVLIIGANGLLGHAIQRCINPFEYDIYAADSSYPAIVNNKKLYLDIYNFIMLDTVLHEVKPNIIIHCAAMTNVDDCEIKQYDALRINHYATVQIAEYCKKYNVRLIFISTDAIFDGRTGPYSEIDTPNPQNFYGFTKYISEIAIRYLLNNYLIIRTSLIFGKEDCRKINFVDWVLNQLKTYNEVKVVNGQYSNPTYNEDLASNIVYLMDNQYTGVINIAGNSWLSRYEFAKKIAQAFNYDIDKVIPVLETELVQIAKRPRYGGFRLNRQVDIAYPPLDVEDALDYLKDRF